jgi:oxygen-independent coproporphyrinogen-3 oxidase
LSKNLSTNQPVPDAAYVHIPFCRSRCFYCDFPVSVIGSLRGETSGTMAQYVAALGQEIELTLNWRQPLRTIFFGGGTPSLLSVQQLEAILMRLDQKFGIAADAEISMEMDPGTFDLNHLRGYLALGVNRISLGVQAFQADLLKDSGRSHTIADIYTAIALFHQAGVTNFSLDLISGLPHQTLKHWQTSLEAAIAIAPSHLSAYDLIVEPGTAFSRQYQPGDLPLPSESQAADMYRMARQHLTIAGYHHYEISNYAQPGYQCRHNRVYWENRPFYGFGMGAASSLNGDRFTRPRKTHAYYRWLQAEAKGYFQALEMAHPTAASSVDRLLETLMLGLRLAEGLDWNHLIAQFGTAQMLQVWDCLRPYLAQGWVEMVNSQPENPLIHSPQRMPDQGHLRLSDPEGFLFSNTILATLFSRLE